MKKWTPRLYVVEIFWKHASCNEWLFHAAYTVKRIALQEAANARKSGYRFRVVPYNRAE